MSEPEDPQGAWVEPPPPPPSPRHARRLPVAAVTALAALAVLVGGVIGHVAWGSAPVTASAGQSPSTANGSNGSTGSNGSGYQSLPPTSGGPSDAASIAGKVAPALVDINSTFSYQSAQGAGTGIVLTSDGEILTNNHVINGATKISVTDVGNGRTYGASVVGYDPTHDIAVLQLKGASGLQTANLGDSSKVSVGESVVAVGNAGGTGGTPSSAGGSVTALNQAITASDELNGVSENLSGVIEVNADIQAGDSGGALVDTAGQVIGINTAASQGFALQSMSNQGFAIPIDQALATARQIESGQGSSTVHVGSTAALGLLLSSSSNQGGFGGSGVGVSGVVSGGAAARAGITQGDTVTSVGGQAIDSLSTLSGMMLAHHPGDTVQLGWTDTSGQSHTATVQLGSGPPA